MVDIQENRTYSLETDECRCYKDPSKSFVIRQILDNKHSESITEAIHVPYRPQQKLELDLFYAMSNAYTKFQVNISKDSREKVKKSKF